jgi:parvulin-like peptidyl-prolyl isomerase
LTAEQAGKVVAKIGDEVITLGQFADRLASQSPYLRARYNSPERRREFLDNMVRFELLAIEAKKRGHDEQPEVKRVREQMMVQQMMKELFDDKGVKLSDITDEEIKQYYAQNKQEFEKPEQRRASHILIKDKAKAESVLKQLREKPEDMQLFRDLARTHNVDPETKERFGDLRFFALQPEADEAERAPPKELREAAFKLAKTGDLHPEPIQTADGFHILKLTGERAALSRSLEDARRLIQNRLWRKRREAAIEEFVGQLRQKANVKENLELLGQVKVDLTAPIPGEADGQHGERDDDHGHSHKAPGTAQ